MIKKGQILNDINLNASFMSKTEDNSIIGALTTPQGITAGGLTSTGTATIAGNTTISGNLTVNAVGSGQISLGASGSSETDLHYTNSAGTWQVGINNNGNGTSNNQFFFYEGSSYRFTIQKGTGNVGINSYAPSDLLTIAAISDGTATSRKAVKFVNGGWAAPAAMNATSDGDKLIIYKSAAESHAIGLENANMWLQSYSGIKFYNSSAVEKARIALGTGDNYFLTGSLGVGTSTPGTWSGMTPGGANLQVYSSSTYSRMIINSATNDPEIHLIRGANAAGDKNYRFTVTANNLTLDQPSDDYTTTQQLMTWTKDGNVGINTTSSPTHKLQVDGSGDANNSVVGINVSGVAPFRWASSAICSGLTAGTNVIHMIGQAENTKNAGYIGFNYQGAGSDNNFLTFGLFAVDNVINLTGAGRVGIGTTSPATTLDVNGIITTKGIKLYHPTGPYTADIFNVYGSDAYGMGVYMNTGGALIVGAGESASVIYTNLSASAEELWLASDGVIKFMANCQNGYATRKEMSFDTSGNLTLPGTVTWSGGGSANANSAYSHISNNGSDHSYINQSVTTTSAPTFSAVAIGNASVAATDGAGIKFWTSDNYKIYMSASGTASWGGKLDTTSDYNLYFKMTGGTNRGFVFLNSTTPVAQIDSTGKVYAQGGYNVAKKFEIQYNSTENSLDFVYVG